MYRLALPVMIGAPPLTSGHWWWIVWEAWQRSQEGDIDAALDLYREADHVIRASGNCLNPSLSVIRHNGGTGEGTVRPVPPNENIVVSLFLPRLKRPEAAKANSLIIGVPTENMMDMGDMKGGDDRSHVMVMSTGRCGTQSLFRLFQNSNLESYHTYWFMQHPFSRAQFLCRLFAGRHEDKTAVEEWVSCRRPEWFGEKPMIGLNHTDTGFAPVFAALNKNSRFVYLRRDPSKVFKSFIDKGQWAGGANHFVPISCSFRRGFRFSLPDIHETDGVLYHLYYTEAFSRAFGRVMGDRWIEISSDRLFGQDREEVAKLLEFTGSDIDLDFAVEHFATKINEKAHKCHS